MLNVGRYHLEKIFVLRERWFLKIKKLEYQFKQKRQKELRMTGREHKWVIIFKIYSKCPIYAIYFQIVSYLQYKEVCALSPDLPIGIQPHQVYISFLSLVCDFHLKVHSPTYSVFHSRGGNQQALPALS